MRKNFTLLPVFILFSIGIYAQSATLVTKANLPTPTLKEISGAIEWGGKLYALNDGGNSATIYELDSTSGAITKTVTLGGTTNGDWEDLTQDDTYFYIGDFGNNGNGSRTDLKFYRFPKQAFTDITGNTGTIPSDQIETINFSYENQDAFCPGDFICRGDSTRFDCEAVLYHNGKLHLFTKNWLTAYTVHYTVPTTPGTYIAEKKDSLDTQGFLITSATKMNDKIVALLGYTNPFKNTINTQCALWLITGFTDMNDLFSGAVQKQKIALGPLYDFTKGTTSNGQIESITAVSQTRVLITNEDFLYSIAHVPPHLYGLNLDNFISQELLPSGLYNLASHLTNDKVLLSWEYTDAGVDYFEIEVSNTGNNDFVPLDKVYANASSNGKFSYSDNNGFQQSAKYYRIKVVKQSGNITYSEILLIKKNNDHLFNLNAFPSPFNDNVAVSFYSDTQQNVQLAIQDVFGRKVHTKQLQCVPGKYSVSLEGLNGLSKGIYFITASTKSDRFVRRIVKQ